MAAVFAVSINMKLVEIRNSSLLGGPLPWILDTIREYGEASLLHVESEFRDTSVDIQSIVEDGMTVILPICHIQEG
jgi:hypothetical protein